MCAYPVQKTMGGVTNAVVAPNLPQMARGSTVTFEQDFFDDAPANSQPSVPIDGSAFPSWTVVDPLGVQIGTGVATPGSQTGRWQFQWNVLVDATLSSKDNKWKVIWRLQSTSGRQLDAAVYFDVIDLIVPDTPQELRAYGYITYLGKSERVMIQRPRRPFELTCEAIVAASGSSLRPDPTVVFSGSLTNGDIKEVADGSLYTYYFDTPALTEPVDYQVVWSLRETLVSPSEVIVQKLSVPDLLFWSVAPELRTLVDKLQKNLGTIHAYSDSDLHEYLTQGIGIMNGVIPATGWTWQTFPLDYVTRMFWMEASGLWALQAQHLLETELLFSFCLEENTLVHTTRGLVKAKDLVGINTKRLASELVLSDRHLSVLGAIHKQLEAGKWQAKDIIRLANLRDVDAQQLGLVLAHAGLNEHRETNHAGGYLWDVSKFWSSLYDRFDLSFRKPKYPARLESKYDLLSVGETKTPEFIWDLGKKDVYRLRTRHGYEEKTTLDHGFLTLNTQTFKVGWKRLKDIAPGDFVAVDKTGEKTKNWTVELPYQLPDALSTSTEKDYGYKFPKALTPELARVLGYLVSEGTTNKYNFVCFSNTDERMLSQFMEDFKTCFGEEPTHFGESLSPLGNVPVRHIGGDGVRLRRYLAAIGLDYSKSRKKQIPWCILQAPLSLAAEFLKAYFDGDGHFAESQLVFCSFSPQLRSQVQSLLLRFGIMSVNSRKGKRVTVRYPSLETYHERVGFLHKGEYIDDHGLRYPARETIPEDMLFSLRQIKAKVPAVNAKGWYADPNTGEKKRATLYWDHCSKGSKSGPVRRVTWQHVLNWWNDGRREMLELLAPRVAERLAFLLDTQFQWEEVVSIKHVGKRRVLDPCLPDGPDLLAHGFTANGLVNHNSGQTVTLDVDRTGGYDTAIQRMLEDVKGTGPNSWPNVKRNLTRRVQPAAVVGARMMGRRYQQQFTYLVDRGGVGTTSDGGVLTLLGRLGLA